MTPDCPACHAPFPLTLMHYPRETHYRCQRCDTVYFAHREPMDGPTPKAYVYQRGRPLVPHAEQE